MTNEEKIQLIGQKIFVLSSNLDKYKNELQSLQKQLNELKAASANIKEPSVPEIIVPETVIQENKIPEPEPEKIIPPVQQVVTEPVNKGYEGETVKSMMEGLSIEENIGARWFSIIGIITLVLGIGIGVKYAIDNDLINETTRLVLGYFSGIIILAIAMFNKKKYEVFSAILLSGAMSLMYYTTFVGYSHYHFFSAPVAFVIMALFTGFTVFAAHIYNYEIIALLGLVGGYALPPLLSTGSGEIQYMFGFMLVLNAGILVLSFIKYWKFVNHVAYGLTWLIFVRWMAVSYDPYIYLGRTLFFSTVFYLIFYLSFIAYKVFRNKEFSFWDVVLVMSNSLIYFGVGYGALNKYEYESYQGLFCVWNAMVHLGFAFWCRKKELSDKTIYHFILALVISFITMAIPIQLDGNFVSIIWICEMIVLLYMANKTSVNTYKYLAYAISLLAFFSLWHDWSNYTYFSNNTDTTLALKPILNKYFLTSIIGTGGFALALILNKKNQTGSLQKIASITLAVLGLIVVYMTFANEIILYFDIQYKLTEYKHIGEYGSEWTDYDSSWKSYMGIWLINYSIVYFAVLSWFSFRKGSSIIIAYTIYSLNLIMTLIAFGTGLMLVIDLKEEAVHNYAFSHITTWNYNVRYALVPFLILCIGMIYFFRNSELLSKLKTVNTCLFHFFVLVLLSNELSHIITMLHLDEYRHYQKVAFRIGYTVLWGLYSMSLITYGILRKKKLLRIIAISLFGLTLLKLATDAMSMTMGYRLIVFIVIGIILLLVSFMYQKFKPLLFGDSQNENIQDEKN